MLLIRKEGEFEASKEKLAEVLEFAEAFLEESGCPLRTQMQITVAVEEVFINIASYAYPDGKGMMTLRMEIKEDPQAVEMIFTDSGTPYDPLAKEDPDVTLSAEDRQIGGLGIFMFKKMMDDVRYEYRDGKNVLTLIKNIL